MITLNGGFDEGSTMTNGFDGHRDDDETPPRMRTTSSSSTKGVDHPHPYRREGCCASGGRGTNCRSNESIVPLSPSGAASGAAVTTTTNNNTTATTDFKRLPIAVSQQKQKRRSSLLCGLGPSNDDDDDNPAENPTATAGPVGPSSLVEAPTPASHSDWMGELPDHAHFLPFNQLSIPGSHDSCTASLDRDGGLHADAPELYRDVLRVLGSWAKTVAHRWSQTQDKTFTEQLHLGIRYFDLRISVRPGCEELYLVHGFYGETVKNCLTAIRSWLDLHPREVVLLDMNHFHGLEKPHHQRLVEDILEIFGAKLVPRRNDARELTLAQMWKEGQQVVVFYHHVEAGVSTPNSLQPTLEYLWPGSMIPSPWPRTTRIKDLIDFLDKNVQQQLLQSHQ